MNNWLSGGEAAAQIVTRPGITSGQKDTPSPAIASANSASVQPNTAASCPPLSERHSMSAVAPARSGIGTVTSRPGQTNQRCQYLPSRKGVARLTSPSASRNAGVSQRAKRRASACAGPSVFHTSQPAPSSA